MIVVVSAIIKIPLSISHVWCFPLISVIILLHNFLQSDEPTQPLESSTLWFEFCPVAKQAQF